MTELALARRWPKAAAEDAAAADADYLTERHTTMAPARRTMRPCIVLRSQSALSGHVLLSGKKSALLSRAQMHEGPDILRCQDLHFLSISCAKGSWYARLQCCMTARQSQGCAVRLVQLSYMVTNLATKAAASSQVAMVMRLNLPLNRCSRTKEIKPRAIPSEME